MHGNITFLLIVFVMIVAFPTTILGEFAHSAGHVARDGHGGGTVCPWDHCMRVENSLSFCKDPSEYSAESPVSNVRMRALHGSRFLLRNLNLTSFNAHYNAPKFFKELAGPEDGSSKLPRFNQVSRASVVGIGRIGRIGRIVSTGL